MRGIGPVMLLWIGIFLLIFLIPFGLIAIRPETRFLLALFMIVAIYNFLRGFFGDNWITVGLTALFAYLFVYKHFWESLALWWFNILLGLGAFSLLGWLYIGVMQVARRR